MFFVYAYVLGACTASLQEVLMTHEDIKLQSADGQTTCIGDIWLPKDVPCGIVQIVHGMVEHFRCYDQVAEALTSVGYVVCGIDQLGHGRTTPHAAQRGIYDPKHGADYLIEDQHALRQLVSNRFPKLPYVMLGHSMGSFVVRCYIARYGEGLAGAIIMGTAWMASVAAPKLITSIIARFHGWGYRSAFVDSMGTGSYNKSFEGTGANTGYEWLSSDPARPISYAADPDCGWMFSVSGYYVIAQLLEEAERPEALMRIPHELPVLILSGEQDPVGENGKGPRSCAMALRKAGLLDVTIKLYPNARHELHNERCRQDVRADVVKFLERVCVPAGGEQ